MASHDPSELLPEPVQRVPVEAAFVDVPGDDLRLALRWVRHLAPLDLNTVVRPPTAAHRRVLEAATALLPRVAVDSQVVGDVVVSVDPAIEPPSWAWLPSLLAALDRPGVAAAQPLLLLEDFTVGAPVLVGHPVSAVERLDGQVVPERFPGVEARRAGVKGSTVLATGSWLPGPEWTGKGPGWEPLRAAAARVTVAEGRPSLRWAIDIAAGAAPIGRRWGDWHFARSLASALERLGQWVEIDHPETRGRATRAENDVVLTLRGLHRVAPQPGAVNLLWVISHPHDVSSDELASYDVAYAAGTAWAARHGITPLLQCTDTTRFHPGVGTPGSGDAGALFVGNARGELRPAVATAREAGVPLRVIGTGWDPFGVSVEADRIANEDLPEAYASAGVVLNDHWEDMRVEGFISNRVFDVLAVGGRLLTDDVSGLSDVLGVDLPTWRTSSDLVRLATTPYDLHPDPAARLALAERVVAEHSFDARAATLLDAALQRARGGGSGRLDSRA